MGRLIYRILRRPLTIGNIHYPPHNNNNNETITKFINELTPIVGDLQKQYNYASIVGDFNINLLEIKEREIFLRILGYNVHEQFLSEDKPSHTLLKSFM